MLRSAHIPASSARVAAMFAAFVDLLATGKTASEEGRDVVLSMLVVGLVFVGAIIIGDVWSWRSHKRDARRG
jgi:hypothetical protein